MKKNIYTSKEYSMAIKVDSYNRILYAYSYFDGFILDESEGILQTLDKEIADEVEASLQINLADFGVEIINDK